MKAKDYYSNMFTVRGCIDWAERVGLKAEGCGPGCLEFTIPRDSRDEVDVSIYLDGDENDLEFINHMNRLRRWKERTDDPEKV